MTTDYITRAIRFIHQIFPYIENCHNLDDMYWGMMEFNKDKRRRVIMEHGATRIALITSDYVIKLDYGDDVDYYGGCERELEFYRYACDEGFGEYFTPVSRISHGGINFYIYPRATNVGHTYIYRTMPEVVYEWIICHVYDLHSDNLGQYNGHGVVIDYALNTLWRG